MSELRKVTLCGHVTGEAGSQHVKRAGEGVVNTANTFPTFTLYSWRLLSWFTRSANGNNTFYYHSLIYFIFSNQFYNFCIG